MASPESKAALVLLMRRHILSLIAILLLLAFTGWSPAASAHPGHMHEPHAQSTMVDCDQTVVHHNSESGAPCDCPAGRCDCGVDCLTHCLISVAVADAPAFRLFRAPVRFEQRLMASIAEWTPPADKDPPRPSA